MQTDCLVSSNYEQISRENVRESAAALSRLTRDVLVDQYSDPTHFVFELLQNAEDALRRRDGHGGSRSVRFELSKGCVRLSHFGDPFNDRDVRGVCGVAEGTKRADPTAIGSFGIGFKSVYVLTDRPEVHSGDEHFAIEDYFHPRPISPITLNEGETVIVLPLQKGDAAEDIVRQFRRLGKERTLLFLRKINEIEWSVQGGASGTCRREETSEGEGVRRVRLLSEAAGEEPLEENWLVLSRPVDSKGEPAGHVELAFKLVLDDSRKDMIAALDESCLVVFFPTAFPTQLGMLVQGPYRTTPNRENIRWGDTWNRHLVEETADLLVDALRHLREHGLLGVHVFDALPLSRSRFHDDNPFAPMFDAVRDAVAREGLLPAHRGGYVAASRARLTSDKGLRNLVSRSQLAELFGGDEPVAWLTGDITKYGTRTLYDYLTVEHGIREIGTEDLLGQLDEAFLKDQDDWWIRRLYEFLNRQRDQDDFPDYLLEDVPLLRLEDGTHAVPYGEPVPFLPTKGRLSPQDTVRSAVCDSRPALEFLKSLDLSEFDRVDAIIRDVIPRYSSRGKIDESRYPDDWREIVDAYHAASADRKRQLTDALGKAFFVRAVDAGTGELSFVRPSDVYLPTKRLRALFDGIPSVLFPDRAPRGLRRRDSEALLRACDASETLAAVEFDNLGRFTGLERRQMRGKDGPLGDARQEKLIDSKFAGLEQLLDYLPRLPLEEGAARANLLWEALCDAAERPGQPGFRANYTWRYYSKRRGRRPNSASVSMLNDAVWVPDDSGHLQQPRNVEFASLGWNADPFLESLIKFKPPEPPSKLRALAAEAGVGVDSVEVVKEAQDEGLDVKRILRGELRKKRTLANNVQPRTTEMADAANNTMRTGDNPGGSGGVRGDQTSGGERFRPYTYIGVEWESEGTAAGRSEHERRMSVEEAAIALILEYEPELKRTGRNNPGYDLYEPAASGAAVRWIEVKAMAGAWDSQPVTLTHTQFDLAREKGDAYWLYVVEHAETDRAEIIKINDPAGWESSYTFDRGWRVLATPTDGVPRDVTPAGWPPGTAS